MVERVARAIFASEYVGEFPTGGIAHALELQKARAAIEAMRERTGPMIRAGGERSHMKVPMLQNLNAMAIWRAMIDAALSEQPATDPGIPIFATSLPDKGIVGIATVMDKDGE